MFQKGHKKFGGKKEGTKNKKTIQQKVEQELALKFLQEEIRKNWAELIQAKKELALGVWYEKKYKDKPVRVYQKLPDAQSLQYLFSIVVGKPKESIEFTRKPEFYWGEDEEPAKKSNTERAIESIKAPQEIPKEPPELP